MTPESSYLTPETVSLAESRVGVTHPVISVIDNMNLAYLSIEKAGGKIDQGLILIKNQLLDTIKKRGAVKIELKPGDPYNPMYHEAIEMIPADGLSSGTVGEIVEDGYVLHDYVLKPSRVKVVQ